MINLKEVGAHPLSNNSEWQVCIGIYLPNITENKSYRLIVRIIHEKDQFVRAIQPKSFTLHEHTDHEYGLWDVTVNLSQNVDGNFGTPGRYLYRFELTRDDIDLGFWFADPFGRDVGTGTLSAFTIGDQQPFTWSDNQYQVPHVDDLVVYELHVGEFNADFIGVLDQLDYLWELGINAIEFMPITPVKESAEWGYTPLGYFAPEDRFGTPDNFKRLVDACHAKNIAVILDSVYAHSHPEFAYNQVYNVTGEPNPMMGVFEGEFFGHQKPGTDFDYQFTREYFLTVNQYWLSEYHVDGFRYDYVPGFYDGAVGHGYSELVSLTYQESLLPKYPRFKNPNYSTIIQCAEYLYNPREILAVTYSNTCWQNELYDKSREMVNRHSVDRGFAHLLDPEFSGYVAEYHDLQNQVTFPVAPFQYIETHDHSRFVNWFGWEPLSDLIETRFGDRSLFYRTQPYVIALYTAKGVPMLWQGQEFAENWSVPESGLARNLFERPLHWEYFYDKYGKALIRLYRILGQLRRHHRALRSRGFYYYNDLTHLEKQVIAFRRDAPADNGNPEENMVIILNFGGADVWVTVDFFRAGNWSEQIDADPIATPPFSTSANDTIRNVKVPANYGSIYLHG